MHSPDADRAQKTIKLSQQHYRKPNVPRRIHIIGATGSIGLFVAHSLRALPDPPPVTLILTRTSRMNEWRDCGKQIRLKKDGVTVAQNGFDVELTIPKSRVHGKEIDSPANLADAAPSAEDTHTIHNLVVTVKAPFTIWALSALKHRLKPSSTILFLQNGMGIIEEVNREIFPDPSTRPHYMLGIISHGVGSEGPFNAIHNGAGTILLGLLTHECRPALGEDMNVFRWATSSRYLLRTITRSPALCATPLAPRDLLQSQLEKLAVNAVINPIGVMLDARNGALLYNYAITRVMRLLLSEISLVIRSLPELKGLPNVQKRFAPDRLETLVVGITGKTFNNLNSMLVDARVGRQTEIDYINGYVVRKGEELGVQCLMNYLMVQLVKGKAAMIQKELNDEVPFVK